MNVDCVTKVNLVMHISGKAEIGKAIKAVEDAKEAANGKSIVIKEVQVCVGNCS